MGRSRRRKRSRYPIRPTLRTPSNDDGTVTEESVTATPMAMSTSGCVSHQDGCSALYVDVVKKRYHRKVTVANEFSITQEYFPALPGTERTKRRVNPNFLLDDDMLFSPEYSSMEELVNYDGDVEHDDDASSTSDLATPVGNTAVAATGSASDCSVTIVNNSSIETNPAQRSETYVENSLPPPRFHQARRANTRYPRNNMSLEAEELRNRIQQIRRQQNKSSIPSIQPTVLKNKYGMLGLANTLRAQASADPSTVNRPANHGSVDATKMGIDLFAKENVHPTFAGPYARRRCEPHELTGSIPHEYIINGRVRLHPPKVSQMEVELLFYFFYLYPGDMMQLLAAAELSERAWRFHIELRVWLRHQDGNPNYTIVDNLECGVFNYFSYNLWKVCEHYFELNPEKIDETKSKIELQALYGDHPQLG